MLYNPQASLILTYTDGRTSSFPFDTDARSLRDADRSTAWRAETENGERRIFLTALESVPLRRASVLLPLAVSEDALAFSNSMTTNGWAEVLPLKELIGRRETCKELVCVRDGSEELHAAFTSVDRLMTCFRFEDGALALHFLLEDKPLPADGLALESFWMDTGLSTPAFLDAYAERMAVRYGVRLPDRIPSGWCSWAVAYQNLTEQDVLRVADEVSRRWGEKKPNLIQLDDSWQKGGIFSGDWTAADTFPNGIRSVCGEVNARGMDFGLWMSPTVIRTDSPAALEHPGMMHLRPDGGIFENPALPGTGTLELDAPEALDYLRESIRLANSYGTAYYKLDFLIFSQLFSWTGDLLDSFFSFKSGYAVEVYRRAMQVIREEAGERYLLSCGATTAENIGIFDGARTTPDITRCFPTPEDSWFLLRKCAANCLYRAFYHKKLFINDPDGVVVREYWNNDTFSANAQEARFWATACAFSGGALLLNEYPWKTAESRLELFERILPPLGIAARPLDFYEQPMPTVAVIDCGRKKLAAVYNLGEKTVSSVLPLARLGFEGECAVVDAWEQKLLGAFSGEMPIPSMQPHSANVYLIQPKPEGRAPLGTLDNLYMGVAEKELKGDCIWWE